MDRRCALAAALVILFGGAPALAQRAELAKARSAYNEQRFDEAVEAALVAQKFPATSDAATLVLSRAYLERYRQRANPTDLAAARSQLGNVRVSNIDARDHLDFLMALGETLFFEENYGAAAELFESGLDGAIAQGPTTGEAMLDWWGSAVERQADGLEREPRERLFAHLRERSRRAQEHQQSRRQRRCLSSQRSHRRHSIQSSVG